MFFTQDDYRKIEEWLRTRTVKDSEFPHADPLIGNEDVPIIQDGKNKTLTINEFVKQVAMMELPDFFNVTTFAKEGNLFLEQAISLVPVEQRKLGLTITFHSEKGHWLIYQFKGTSLNQWTSLNYWRSPIEEALEELVLYPDEEDITGVRDGNRTFLKFKDKDYDPADFSGMGRIMLRKNLVGTEACSLDDEDHLLNVLTQDMIREENTVYIVQYDFDLDGKIISIPEGCTLWFQGGSINNGTIYLQETAILGAFEFADMGNARLFGKFNTGQIMTFPDDSYKAKTGGYFVAGTKPSSATPEEDAKNERETFYDKNPDAYTTQARQELRWWNGEEWILILDIADYNEIKSIINDLIEKHNAEMSACYKYFKARCYALEVRMNSVEERLDEHDTTLENYETRITNVEGAISNITDIISNLDQVIDNHIQQFIENNVIGVSSITINGTKYEPDNNGNITLPDYPETGGGQADSVKGTLTVKTADGVTLTSYNGSEDKILTLPSGEGGTPSIADKVAHKLKFTGASTAEYDGSQEVTVNIPTGGSSGGGSPNQPLIFRGAVNETYDGTVEKTITIPEQVDLSTAVKKLHVKATYLDNDTLPNGVSEGLLGARFKSYDIDLLKSPTRIDISPMLYGDPRKPIVLATLKVRRESPNSPWEIYRGAIHPFMSITLETNYSAVAIRVNYANTSINPVIFADGTFATSTSTGGAEVHGRRLRSAVIGLRCCTFDKNTIYVQGIRTDDKNNDSINTDPAGVGGGLLEFNLTIFGYIPY